MRDRVRKFSEKGSKSKTFSNGGAYKVEKSNGEPSNAMILIIVFALAITN
jgi:hypothetical protein